VAWPEAEVEVDEMLVRKLLIEQHRDLADRTIRALDSGFDNVSFRLGDDLGVRLPRRAAAVPLIVNEQRWLPRIADRLPLPIPAPARIGKPSRLYPWPWSIVPWLHGDTGDRSPLAKPADAGRRLGSFLTALHRPAPASAPFSQWRSVSLARRADSFEHRMAELDDSVDSSRLLRVWATALRAEPHPGPSSWIHGDLHPGNILIADGTVSAVIDFGDLCAGDPATDVATVWMTLPAEGWDHFWSDYRTIDRGLWHRSIGWAILFATMLVGLGEDRPSYGMVGRRAIELILANEDR
jgi:aminoglycoside phosphotransferase (APT) family kinase protein